MSDSTSAFPPSDSAPATRPAAPGGTALRGAGARQYRVFLSYSHSDTAWARWLMRRLESYQVPKRFRGLVAPIGLVGPRIAPVFRDRDELPTTSDLGETIRGALRESATLVVICSPASARSRWVQEEICAFKRLHGPAGVFAFIVAGEPKVEGAADDCFSPALRHDVGPDGQLSTAPAEVVAADARRHGDGRSLAFIRLVAGLLGVGFDQLRQREHLRRIRRLTWITSASAVGMAITLGLAIVAVRARNDAQRRQDQAEDLAAFMLGDFRTELKKVGQLKLLNTVGEKALKYFAAADPSDLTDASLTRQAKALTQLGEVRMEEAKFDAAEYAFKAALARSAALAARHPQDADMLFERAQAEFWIGAVARGRGDTPATREWITRYRDTAVKLVALDHNAPRAQGELISAHHNLAVLEHDNGNHAAARSAFLAEAEKVDERLAATPDDVNLRMKRADIASWLGLIGERTGDLAEAAARHAEALGRMRELVAREPAVSRWRVKLADYLGILAAVQAITDRREEALAAFAESKELFGALAVQDPKNAQWRYRGATVQINQVPLLWGGGRAGEAARMLQEGFGGIQRLAAAEPSSQRFNHTLAKAWRCEATQRLQARRSDAAEAAAQAIQFGEVLLRDRRADDQIIAEFAQAHVMAGRIHQVEGRPEEARLAWQRALEALGPRLRDSTDWRFLDPAAQAFVLLGQADAARPLLAALRRSGYHAPEPLAAATLAAAP